MIGGRSALLSAAGGGNPYGNWTGNYEDVSLLLRGYEAPRLVPIDESQIQNSILTSGQAYVTQAVDSVKYGTGAIYLTKGTSSYVQAGGVNDPAFNFGSNDFTIEAWVKPSVTAGINTVVGTMAGPFQAEGWALHVHDGQLRFQTFNNSSNVAVNIAGGTIPLNVYTHIAVVRSGASLLGFVDGTQVWSRAISGNLITTNAISKVLRLGRQAYTTVAYDYGGAIDDLRITKDVARYASSFTPPTVELPANVIDDPNYNSVSLLLRNGVSGPLAPLDEGPAVRLIFVAGDAGITATVFKYGTSSLAFDGSGDYIETDATTGFDFANEPFTIEAWINVSVLTSLAGVVSVMNNLSSTGLQGYVLFVDSNGAAGFGDYTNGNAVFSLTSAAGLISVNTWYHIAVCKEGVGTNQVRLFINGQAVATGTRNASIPVSTSGQPARIGAWRFPTALRFFNGYIDDLRITKGFARYTKNFLPPPAELPAI